jgi:hypothetical protein
MGAAAAQGWTPGPTGYPQQGVQQQMFMPTGPMYGGGSGQMNVQGPWMGGQDLYGQQTHAWQFVWPIQPPGQLFGQHQGYRPHNAWPVGGQQGYGAPWQYTPPQAQGGGWQYTPPQAQAVGATQGGGRQHQYICFRCRKPGHIAPHCTGSPSEQGGGQ